MSQITLPWIERSPEKLAGYRRAAISRLIGLGAVHLALAVAGAIGRPVFVESLDDAFRKQAEVLESRRVGVNIWYKIKSNEAKQILKVLGI